MYNSSEELELDELELLELELELLLELTKCRPGGGILLLPYDGRR